MGKRETRKTIYTGMSWNGGRGKREEEVECPFCHSKHIVYIWSFAGVGKKCDCGAGLGYLISTKEVEE